MTKNVLLIGRRDKVLEALCHQLKTNEVNLFSATTLEVVLQVLGENKIDVVIMGSGLEIDLRCEIVRYITINHPSTTIHMKDWTSGPDGIMPFVTSVLKGL